MKELLAKFLEDDADMKDLNLTARAADAQQRTRSLLERVSMDASAGAERDDFADRQPGSGAASSHADGSREQREQRQQAGQAERAGSSSHMQAQQAEDGVTSHGDEHPGSGGGDAAGSSGGDGQAAMSGQPSGGSSRLQDSAFSGSGKGEWSGENGEEDADAFPGPEHPHSPQPGSPAALLAEEEADERARAEEEVIDVVEQLLEAYCMQVMHPQGCCLLLAVAGGNGNWRSKPLICALTHACGSPAVGRHSAACSRPYASPLRCFTNGC